MGAVKEVQEFWQSLPKYSFVKMIIYLILLIIACFLLIVLYKAATGEPVKIFGFEVNNRGIIPKTDTLKNKYIVPSKKDTLKVYVKTPIIKQVKVFSHKTKLQKGDTIFKNQTTISGGTNIHSITGNGNHDILNGDQYNGIKQRHIGDALKTYLKITIPQKSTFIEMFYSASDKESKVYTEEIYNFLKSEGYLLIKAYPSIALGYQSEFVEAKVFDTKAMITVPVASNVK